MNRIITLTILIILSLNSYAQVKVGDNPNIIDQNSVLELESKDKVLVITRVNDIEMNNIYPLEGALVYNTDQKCIFQYNSMLWESLCLSNKNQQLSFDATTNELTLQDGGTVNLSSLVNDNDNNPTNEIQVLTFDNTTNTLNLLNGGSVNLETVIKDIETLTSIIENNDGTFSYIDENGTSNQIDIKNLETLTSIALNPDNTNIDYTDENGQTTQLNLTNIVKNLETLTSVVENNDGTFSFIDENGGNTQIDIKNLETLTSIALNPDNTNIDYTDENGQTTQLNLTNIVKNLESTSSLIDNGNGTITYVDENGVSSTISLNDNDSDPNNEKSDLILSGNTLTLSNPLTAGNLIDLTPYLNTDNQTLSISGNDLSIADGNTITLPSADGTETVVNAGTNVTVTGDGSSATPYVINST
ncbi:hypothetical protein, partial [Tenacibaculum sp. 190524A02b]